MRVVNIHQRDFAVPAKAVGDLIDSLSSQSDRLWPRDRWPAMRFDRPLQAGAIGGHGPIHYSVESYVVGRTVTFRFIAPRGFNGTHGFDVQDIDGGARLIHTLAMNTSGLAVLLWPLIFRPLHDALIEDSLDGAAQQVSEMPKAPAWSLRARVLRAVLNTLRKTKGAKK